MQKQIPQKYRILQDYEEIEEIGRGCFGTVHRIRRKSDGRIFVWKKICYENMTQQEKIQIVNEVNVLRKLNHRNIIKYVDRMIDKQNQQIYIIMEHCDEGDLGNFLKKKRKAGTFIEEEFVISIFIQLLDALHYCHNRTNKILHRDIKPQNIFLITPFNTELQDKIYEGSNLKACVKNKNNKKSVIVKLGDFGLARYLSATSQLATTHVGTPYYMSPEVLGKGQYDEKSDIWSLGCCIYELVVGKPPFYARSYDELRKYVKDGVVPDLPKCYSSELNNILKLMFERDPLKRPSAEEIFRTDFIMNKSLEQVSKIELSFFMYEYQKLLNYNRYLESILLKCDFNLKKKVEQSDVSTLDTSIDSNISISGSNNENHSQFINSTSGSENKKHFDDSFKKVDNFFFDKEIEKSSYTTPKRNANNLKDFRVFSGSADLNCRANSRICKQSPVTAPTRLTANKNKLNLNDTKLTDDRPNLPEFANKCLRARSITTTRNENIFEDNIRNELLSNGINRSVYSKHDVPLKSSIKNIGKMDITFESEQRLSRWIQRFHSRNKVVL